MIEIELSRPSFRVGSTLVGTILAREEDVTTLVVAGHCRLDSRWHNVTEYRKLYGSHPSLVDYDNTSDLCFWATYPIDLSSLPERQAGTLPELINTQHKAYSFRADLPIDLPPTFSATSCRYYYQVLVRATNNKDGNTFWKAHPIILKTARDAQPKIPLGHNIRIGTALAVAHSHGLPFYLSVTDLHRPTGSIQTAHIDRRLDVVSTLRISDPSERAVAVLSIIGAWHPGRRVTLQLDFPRDGPHCYAVGACLQGTEWAVHRDGSRQKSRTLLLATAYERIDPHSIERLSFDLLVPNNAPITVTTDVVEISTSCVVDMAVQGTTTAYTNLRLEIPCRITHPPENTKDNDDEAKQRLIRYEELMRTSTEGFQVLDIMDDLKVLALSMAGKLGLRPSLDPEQ